MLKEKTFETNLMIDNVIARYGFEAEETINFCYLCENFENSSIINEFYNSLMN